MNISTLTRAAGAGGLTLMLAACMDVSMSVDVTSQTEAEATMVTTMERDMYELMMAQATEQDEEFCAEGELVETADAVECTIVQSGPFAELSALGEEGEEPVIEAIGNGQVRVAFPTADLTESLSEEIDPAQDAQMRAMMASIFEGHTLNLSVSGGTIVDTNMETAADGQSATYELSFTELFSSDLDLPAEIYAVVQK